MKKLFTFLSVAVMGSTAAFDNNNYPGNMSLGRYSNNFDQMKLEAQLSDDRMPWASSFWPHIYGGIAFRWNDYHTSVPSFADEHVKVEELKDRLATLSSDVFSTSLSESQLAQKFVEISKIKTEITSTLNTKRAGHNQTMFSYARPDRLEDVQNMSTAQLNKLSPAEKLDLKMILDGESNRFKLTSRVLRRESGSHKPFWYGICNGWSTAALEFQEPEPVTVNQAGFNFTFYSSDLKALASQYHQTLTGTRGMGISMYGNACNANFSEAGVVEVDGKTMFKSVRYGRRFGDNKIVLQNMPYNCSDDVNAGAFHVILANQIGHLNEGFVAEIDRAAEKWNQPVYGYKSEVLAEGANLSRNRTSGTVRQIRMKTVMNFANDGGRMYWMKDGSDDEFYAWKEPTTGTDNYRSASKTYEYIIDLDRSGDIIGGQWLSYERPDFLWRKTTKGFADNGKYGDYLATGLSRLIKLKD